VLTVVTGPPCSGKSTYAKERHQPGEILIDFDTLARALGSPTPHDHPDPVRWVTIAARRAAINSAIIQHQRGATVWIVHTRISPQELKRYHEAGAEIVTLDVDRAELHARADRERPGRWHQLIDEWRPEAPDPVKRPPWTPDPETRRGRWGRPWRRVRAQVLAASTVCWVCGHDGSDSVDHITPLALGGAALDPANLAPAHHKPCTTCGRRCNTARGTRPGRGVEAEAQSPPVPVVRGRAPVPIASDAW
jgi:hypothetical protein